MRAGILMALLSPTYSIRLGDSRLLQTVEAWIFFSSLESEHRKSLKTTTLIHYNGK